MSLEDRIKQAIQRGQQTRSHRERAAEAAALSAEELKNRHSAARLELTEHIESALRSLCDHFPGFQYQSLMGGDGWGSRISRDDFNPSPGEKNRYSRLELSIPPLTETGILEVSVKGTIFNKEVQFPNTYQFVAELDVESLREQVDQRILEYAEKFAAAR